MHREKCHTSTRCRRLDFNASTGISAFHDDDQMPAIKGDYSFSAASFLAALDTICHHDFWPTRRLSPSNVFLEMQMILACLLGGAATHAQFVATTIYCFGYHDCQRYQFYDARLHIQKLDESPQGAMIFAIIKNFNERAKPPLRQVRRDEGYRSYAAFALAAVAAAASMSAGARAARCFIKASFLMMPCQSAGRKYAT